MQQAVRSAHLIHLRPLLAPHRALPISLLRLDPLFLVLFGSTRRPSTQVACVCLMMAPQSILLDMMDFCTLHGTLARRGHSVQDRMAGHQWLAQLTELERL